jgi:hypothetical protein
MPEQCHATRIHHMSDRAERIIIQVADDKQTIAVNFLPASGATGGLTLTLAQLTDLIQGLGEVRAQLVEGMDIPPLEGQTITSIVNTRWHIQPELLGGGSALTFAHPSYGAIGFIVSRDQLPLMVSLLAKHLEIQPATTGRPN